jgi:hypothetical protein
MGKNYHYFSLYQTLLYVQNFFRMENLLKII